MTLKLKHYELAVMDYSFRNDLEFYIWDEKYVFNIQNKDQF